MAKKIMTFQIVLDESLISELNAPTGKVTMIPFSGSVSSDLFSGIILPGAVDVQKEGPSGTRHMCAQYLFEGTDRTGTPCRLFVKNDAYFCPGENSGKPIKTEPVFLTDSKELMAYLGQNRFYAYVIESRQGVDIEIWDCLV